MIHVKKFLLNHFWILPILLSLPAGFSLLVPGYYGASDDLHAAWLFELDRAIRTGQIPPRFVPDLSYGFGYPLFSFVYPLPFYIAEIFHLFGFGLVDSIKLLFFLTIPLSAWLMYLFLRKFVDRALALAAAVIYIYTPYRSVDIYIRGAIGEILGFIFLPLIGIVLISLSESKRWNFRSIGLGSIAIGGLILTHNIMAYMVLPFFALLFLLLLFRVQQKFLFLIQTIISGLLGGILSCYFWVPAILESGLMKYDTVFNYADHFPTIRQLVTPYWGYGASVPGPYDGLPFFIGFPALVLLSGVIGVLVFSLIQRKKIRFPIFGGWALLVIFLSFGMMNYRSDLIWKHIPLLPYFQFPWRFLIMVTFATPLLLVFFQKVKYQNILAVSLILLAMGTMVLNFRPHDFLGRTDQYYLNRYIPYPIASADYALTQEEYLRLPKETEERPDRLYPLVTSSDQSAVVTVRTLNALDSIIQITATQGAVLDYNKYNYPGWEIIEDGKPIKVVSGKPFGQIQISAPAGFHKYEIYFRETQFRMLLNYISGVGLLGVIGLLTIRNRKNHA